jgi:hypothetical protein
VWKQKSGNFKAKGELAWLQDWDYQLGAELLSPFGRKQLFDLGVGFRIKYGKLLKEFKKRLPVFRTESQLRPVSLFFAMLGLP